MKRNLCGPFYPEDDIGLLVLPYKLEGSQEREEGAEAADEQQR